MNHQKYCHQMRQPCPNDPACTGCDAVNQHESNSFDVKASWRDYIGLIDLAGAIALIVFAGWISSYFWGLK